MSKLSFKTFSSIKTIEPATLKINETEVTVEQYLPLAQKTALIEKVLSAAMDDTGFFSPIRLKVYYTIEMISNYTNINITDKMLENADKTYDAIVMNNLGVKVLEAIPQEEQDCIWNGIQECAKAIALYQNSFVGMMKNSAKDFDATKLDLEDLMATLDQPEKVGLVKEVLDKMG